MIAKYVTLGLSVALVGGIVYHNTTVSTLEGKLESSQAETIVNKLNLTTCKGTLEKQNSASKKIEADLENRTLELEIWKNRPAKIKYKYVYKELPKEYKNAKCEDVVDSIRGINLNNL